MPSQTDRVLLLTGMGLYIAISLLYTVLRNLSEKQESNLIEEYGRSKNKPLKRSLFPYIVIFVVVCTLELFIYKYM